MSKIFIRGAMIQTMDRAHGTEAIEGDVLIQLPKAGAAVLTVGARVAWDNT